MTPAKVLRLALGGLGGVVRGEGDDSRAGMRGMKIGVAASSVKHPGEE